MCLIIKNFCVHLFFVLCFFFHFLLTFFLHFLLPPIVEVDISDITIILGIILGIANTVKNIILVISNTHQKTSCIAQYTDSWNELHSSRLLAQRVRIACDVQTIQVVCHLFSSLDGLFPLSHVLGLHVHARTHRELCAGDSTTTAARRSIICRAHLLPEHVFATFHVHNLPLGR